jgi:hypothetical protein
MNNIRESILRKYRIVLALFMAGLVLSGVTAFPLEREMGLVTDVRGTAQLTPGEANNSLDSWLLTVRDGLREAYSRHPWIAYGTDWLAFAHIAVAIFFIGPYRDPVRNVWVLQAGVAACLLIIPLAQICGSLRQIPWGWRLVDCSFGVFGAIPLLYRLKLTKRLAEMPPR